MKQIVTPAHECYLFRPSPAFDLTLESNHFGWVVKLCVPNQSYGPAIVRIASGEYADVVVIDPVEHTRTSVRSNAIGTIRALDDVNKETHRQSLALILSEVEG